MTVRSSITKALTAIRGRAAPPSAMPVSQRGGGGWFAVVREPYTGAWQKNDEQVVDNVVARDAVFACVTLIANDISKLGLRLVEQDANGIWSPVDVPAFSPFLRKPNRYQNRITFVAQWLTSKLIHGNAYVLKQRDQRGVVVAGYVLDPTRVTVLVADDGSIYYQLKRDDLSGLANTDPITVPAREIFHDLMVPIFHPLIGVSPIFACGLAAVQGLTIQTNSKLFFANGSQPGGLLLAPEKVSDETVARLKAYWEANFTGPNVGRVAVLGDNLKYEPLSVNPVDSQLLEQLQWSAKVVCSCYHIPAYKIGAADLPTFNNIEALNTEYYSQCLQVLIESFELCLDEGLELPSQYGTEFDLDDLLRMDTATKTKAAADGVGSGCLSPNEARKRFFDLGPVKGGDSPFLQQQYYSLKALAERDAAEPFAKPTAATPPSSPDNTPPPEPPPPDDMTAAKLFWTVNQKAIAAGLYV